MAHILAPRLCIPFLNSQQRVNFVPRAVPPYLTPSTTLSNSPLCLLPVACTKTKLSHLYLVIPTSILSIPCGELQSVVVGA